MNATRPSAKQTSQVKPSGILEEFYWGTDQWTAICTLTFPLTSKRSYEVNIKNDNGLAWKSVCSIH